MAAEIPAPPPLGKSLASTDKKTRDKAIKQLSLFLSQHGTEPSAGQDLLPEAEMAKLWKGIFYCFWMSDKPLVQQALAAELAELLLAIKSTQSSLSFLRGFWEAIVREWGGIDRLRMDKYYLLVRKFVNASFRLLIRAQWDESACTQYNDILSGQNGPLCPTDARVPQSLAYHLADIYVEELDKAIAAAEPSTPPAPLALILAPFFALAAHTPTKAVYQRTQDVVLEPLFASLPAAGEDSTSKEAERDESGSRKRSRASLKDEEVPYAHLRRGQDEEARRRLLRQLFTVASAQETRDANRRRLYTFWREVGDDEE